MTAPISVEPMLLWKSNCFDKKFVLRWLCSEIGWVEVRWKNWMTANFHVRKMYSTIKRMDDSEYTTEIIIVPLKERIKTGTNCSKHTTAKRITQTKSYSNTICQKLSVPSQTTSYSNTICQKLSVPYNTWKNGWLQLFHEKKSPTWKNGRLKMTLQNKPERLKE